MKVTLLIVGLLIINSQWVVAQSIPRGIIVAELEDVELELEDAKADSEAAKREAEESKQRREDADEESKKLEREAQNKIAEAKAQERDAKVEIGELDRKIQKLKKETDKHQNDKTIAERRIEKTKASIAKVKKELEKTQTQTEKKLQEKEQVTSKLEAKLEELELVKKDSTDAFNLKNKSKEALMLTQKKLADSNKTLKTEQTQNSKIKAKYKKQIIEYKKKITVYNKQAQKNDLATATYLKKLEQLKEEVSIAEAEGSRSKQRVLRSTERLSELRKKNKKKIKSLKRRKKKAAREKKNNENRYLANMRKIQAIEGGELVKASDNTDGLHVKVSKNNKTASRLIRDCNMRKSASSKGGLITMKKKGSMVYSKGYNSKWKKVTSKSGKTLGYLSKVCF